MYNHMFDFTVRISTSVQWYLVTFVVFGIDFLLSCVVNVLGFFRVICHGIYDRNISYDS